MINQEATACSYYSKEMCVMAILVCGLMSGYVYDVHTLYCDTLWESQHVASNIIIESITMHGV